MWGLWAVPLFLFCILLLVAGLIAALIWHFSRPKDRRGSLLKALSIPTGCAVLPVAFIALVISIFALLEKSDAELYEEIFGYVPEITEDRLLFDDFDVGESTAVFMRAQPTEAERRRLLNIPRLRASSLSLENFVKRGDDHGFSWWISDSDVGGNYCKNARIREAPGFNGWNELLIAECLDAGTEWPASETANDVFLIAGKLEH